MLSEDLISRGKISPLSSL